MDPRFMQIECLEPNPMPEPYPSIHRPERDSPYRRRCDEIDRAVSDITDPDAFIQVTIAKYQLDQEHHLAFQKRPSKKEKEENICPAYMGYWNGGSSASIECALSPFQLHNYLHLKVCEKGRRVYCPLWRAHQQNLQKAGTP